MSNLMNYVSKDIYEDMITLDHDDYAYDDEVVINNKQKSKGSKAEKLSKSCYSSKHARYTEANRMKGGKN